MQRRSKSGTESLFAEQQLVAAAEEPTAAAGGAGAAGGEGAAAGGPSAESLLADLNPQQREAVMHDGGPLLILAGAGSGKTRAITRRIAWLVSQRGVRPDEILAITFTNKAAGEMRDRVARLLPVRLPWISTFHSLCARLLRREIEVLEGYTRDFSIYDTADRNQLLKSLIQSEGYDTTRYRPAQVGAWISDEKNRGGRAPVDMATGLSLDEEVFNTVWRAYEAAMRRANALDFDDLLIVLLRIFDEHPGVRDAWARRFRYVMVDEYQDTNRVQYLLMRHFASFHGNVAVCGDPDQSIYGWRGADVRNILDFEADFPGAKVVRLEQNYRSTKNILAAAQAVIHRNVQRKEKALWSENDEGAKLVVFECADEDDEAREIAAQIRGLERAGLAFDRVAIFYRVNFMQRALERSLRLAQIPYQIVAGTEFYQRREIKDLVAYLKLLVNPADNEAARRALNVPARGIGDKSIELLASWAEDRRVSLLVAAGSEELQTQIRGRARASLAAFSELLARLAPLRESSAHIALAQVIDEIDYYGWLQKSAESADGDGGVDRAANVDELLSYAQEYDELQPDGGLRGFLQDIALVSEADGYAEGVTKVTLMTLHAAKGLEFPAVFIAGLEEELLPHARALADGPNPDLAIEEERRLFYVGMTRARERLFLTHARVRRHFGQDQYASASRFLSEVPRELIEGFRADADEREMLGEYEPDEDAASELSVGDWVEHDHFGRGRIVRLVGAGANARATVAFANYGEKQLLLAYAKLRLVGPDSAGGSRRSR